LLDPLAFFQGFWQRMPFFIHLSWFEVGLSPVSIDIPRDHTVLDAFYVSLTLSDTPRSEQTAFFGSLPIPAHFFANYISSSKGTTLNCSFFIVLKMEGFAIMSTMKELKAVGFDKDSIIMKNV